MKLRPHAYARETDATALFQAAIHGRTHDTEQWYEYVDRFHRALPRANETLFSSLHTQSGHSSYGVLARAAGAAGVEPVDGRGDLVDFELPFRLVEARKPRLTPA